MFSACSHVVTAMAGRKRAKGLRPDSRRRARTLIHYAQQVDGKRIASLEYSHAQPFCSLVVIEAWQDFV
ncbi:hypothetical protein J2Y68_003508 [Paenarthrobacter nitroguajacolicus]|nr:hypothetical protein [Paenarthrobacter nitroguajacolicus]